MKIQFKKLSANAVTPTKNKDDAGYDLYSTEDIVLHFAQRHCFKTDIAAAIPKGYYGRVAPRSGKALKEGVDVMAGVIDSTYRGNIGVILINLDGNAKTLDINNLSNIEALQSHTEKKIPQGILVIKKGEKIAQIIIEKCHEADWQEVEELDVTERAEKGFGSSGK